MSSVAIRVCSTETEAAEAIVRIAAQLDIPESSVAVVRFDDASYRHPAHGVEDVAVNVLLVVGRAG
jgi:hypothetical protein